MCHKVLGQTAVKSEYLCPPMLRVAGSIASLGRGSGRAFKLKSDALKQLGRQAPGLNQDHGSSGLELDTRQGSSKQKHAIQWCQLGMMGELQ